MLALADNKQPQMKHDKNGAEHVTVDMSKVKVGRFRRRIQSIRKWFNYKQSLM